MHALPVLSLILFVLWMLLVEAVRGLVQRRRTGDWGFRRDIGGPGSIRWWAGVLPGLGALAAGAAAPVASLAGLEPFAGLALPAVQAAGVAVAVAGILATFGAQLAMGDSWRIGLDETERTGLVTGGPFRFVRNPIYASMAVVALGLALMVPNLFSAVGVAALIAGIQLQVRLVEEPHMRRTHGAEYAHYEEAVGRFLPGVGRLPRR